MTITKEEADQLKTAVVVLRQEERTVGELLDDEYSVADFLKADADSKKSLRAFYDLVNSLTEKPPAPLLSEQIEALSIGTVFTLNVGGTHDPDPRVRVARGYINTVAPGEVYAFDIWDYHENVTLVL